MAAPKLVLRVRSDQCAVRRVCWQPDPPVADSEAKEEDASEEAAAAASPAAAAEAAAGEAEEGREQHEEAATGPGGGGSPGPGRLRSFLTASQWGELKIWDPEDPFAPVHSRAMNKVGRWR
jgi:hypothetical protein